MSRLYVEDEALYARYKQGELDRDLDICLKAASSEEGVKVSKLNELSALLGDMAHAAIESGNNALTIEELSHEQLKSLAAAMYGRSLKALFSFSDTPALTRFAHKYNIFMEQAIQHFLPTNFEESQTEAMLQLYSSVPERVCRLAKSHPEVHLMELRQSGEGRAKACHHRIAQASQPIAESPQTPT